MIPSRTIKADARHDWIFALCPLAPRGGVHMTRLLPRFFSATHPTHTHTSIRSPPHNTGNPPPFARRRRRRLPPPRTGPTNDGSLPSEAVGHLLPAAPPSGRPAPSWGSIRPRFLSPVTTPYLRCLDLRTTESNPDISLSVESPSRFSHHHSYRR